MAKGKLGTPRRDLLALFAASMFALGALFGALPGMDGGREAAPETPGIESAPAEGDTGGETAVEGERTIYALDETKVEWFGRFLSCGHEYALPQQGELSGMDRAAAAQTYGEYDIELFTSAHVRMVRAMDGYCPAHYILILNGGAVCVMQTSSVSGESEVLMRLPVETAQLDEEYRTALTAGLPFDSLVEINEYLEAAES